MRHHIGRQPRAHAQDNRHGSKRHEQNRNSRPKATKMAKATHPKAKNTKHTIKTRATAQKKRPQKVRLNRQRGNVCPPRPASKSMLRPSTPLLYPRHTELGVPFSQLQRHKAFMKEVVARECNDNINLSWNDCLLSWALKLLQKGRSSTFLGLEKSNSP